MVTDMETGFWWLGPNLVCPLEEELSIIANNKDISNDVFIIDDLRIYEEGPFRGGNFPLVARPDNWEFTGIDFVYDILIETHNVKKNYNNEGYIICEPKSKN